MFEKIISHSDTDTERAGQTLAEAIDSDKIDCAKPVFVALYGELGQGKTAFVRGMAKVLAPDCYVSSPTYSIINMYEGKNNFYHLDLYRITSDDDLYSVGFYELFDDSKAVIAAEWCENIPYALPDERVEVHIAHLGDCDREISIAIKK